MQTQAIQQNKGWLYGRSAFTALNKCSSLALRKGEHQALTPLLHNSVDFVTEPECQGHHTECVRILPLGSQQLLHWNNVQRALQLAGSIRRHSGGKGEQTAPARRRAHSLITGDGLEALPWKQLLFQCFYFK